MEIYNHEAEVDAFFAQCKERDPKKYADVCQRHHVQTKPRSRKIRQREITVGLLGLQESDVSIEVAMKYGIPTIHHQTEGG